MKKPTVFCLLLLLAFSMASCIRFKVHIDMGNDDQNMDFTSQNEELKEKVQPFSLHDEDSLVINNSPFVIREINGEQLRQITGRNSKTWVAMWATWCGECIHQMPSYAQKAAENDLQLVLVCTSYDVKKIEKKLKYAEYKGIAYVLDHKSYSVSENERILAFRKEIHPSGTNMRNAMPHHYIFKGDSVVYFAEGPLKTDSLQAKMK